MDTVSYDRIHDWWGGKVVIDKIKTYTDDRGSLVELWRDDDDSTELSDGRHPRMAYWSLTDPYVTRGPHQHGMGKFADNKQCDNFISLSSEMVYQLYNPDTKEMRHFITDSDSAYRVRVDSPIIHSYTNIGNKVASTCNFPTSLFMGEDKREDIDEVRHEPTIEDNEVYVVFGATGRLGKSLVKNLYDNMGYHTYDVMPIHHKLHSSDVGQWLDSIEKAVDGKKVTIINCAGLTNVQKETTYKELEEVNSTLPVEISKLANEKNWNCILISSDYVFQEPLRRNFSLNNYTKSKKHMEQLLDLDQELHNNTKVVRVSNLLSEDDKDVHNIVHKLWLKVHTNETIEYDGTVLIGPTDVNLLSSKMIDEIIPDEISSIRHYNVVPEKLYTIDRFLKDFFNYSNVKISRGVLNNWYANFVSDNKSTRINISGTESVINNIINKLKGE